MIQVGAPLASDFSDPLGVLRDCHRRIERFLRLLLLVTAQAKGGDLDSEQREALTAALRYFAEAAPQHTADEDDSLFPRLRAARNGPPVEAIDSLQQDHHVAEAAHAEVDRLAHRWMAEGCLPPTTLRKLSEALRELEALYERHIAIEDNQLFPLARQTLGPADIEAIGREMADRRGLRVDSATTRRQL